MVELTLTTPALLFSAVSLILLAYTNRFLSYAQLVRILRDRYMEDPSDINVAQIENLRKRLNLTRMMQVFGIASLFFCVVTMFLIYIGLFLLSIYIFGLALLLLIASLGVSLREIQDVYKRQRLLRRRPRSGQPPQSPVSGRFARIVPLPHKKARPGRPNLTVGASGRAFSRLNGTF